MSTNTGVEEDAPLGRGGRRDAYEDTSKRPEREYVRDEASPSEQSEESREGEQNTPICLIAGPTGTGKTAFLASLFHACSDSTDPSIDTKLTFGEGSEMPGLITTGFLKHAERKGLDASTQDKEYRFEVSADLRRPEDGRLIEELGVSSFSCVDGPGGALFVDNFNPASLPPDMQASRRQLVAAGKSATSLVIFVDIMTDRGRSRATNNLPHVLGELAVRTSIPVNTGRVHPLGGGLLEQLTKFRNRRPDPTASTVPPPLQTVTKLNADRVLIVLNFLDQLCVHWQNEWRRSGDQRHRLDAYRIAREYARPIPIALDVLKTKFLKDVRNFLKPGAKLAVAICSAGGFDKTSGDPCLDSSGNQNLLSSIDPISRQEYVKYFGVQEAILYAGFGRTTPNIVEEVTDQLLFSLNVRKARR